MSQKRKSPAGPTVHFSPAEWVIKQFGGVRATARALGFQPATVSRWRQKPDDRGRGTGGRVPGTSQDAVLKAARVLKLDVCASDLIEGRTVKGRVVKVVEAVA